MTTPTNDPERTSAPTPLDYGVPPVRESKWPWTRIVKALSPLLLLILAVLVILPFTGRPREGAQRIKCASNLRQIGQGIQSYANLHNHQFPKDFGTLLATGDLTAEVFICPDSNDTPAAGATTQAVMTDFAKPGRCSYLYFGAGMHDTDNPQTVVAAEPLANHKSVGANVLFLDGHVEFIVVPAAQKLIAAATTQPTIWPPPQGQ
jgi:prepilin-type processing-associated H-X9-DG protein